MRQLKGRTLPGFNGTSNVAPVFVKICGIMRPADAVAAANAGADAIGLNFVPTSRRSIDLDTARAVLAAVPAGLMTVGVFRDASANEVLKITGSLGLDAAQLHGAEAPEHTARCDDQAARQAKAVDERSAFCAARSFRPMEEDRVRAGRHPVCP